MNEAQDGELDISSALDILDVLMVPLIIFRTKDHWIVYTNDEASHTTGFAKQELLGHKFDDLISEEEKTKFINFMSLAKQSEGQQEKFKVTRKSLRHVESLIKLRIVENGDLAMVLLL